MKTVLLLVLISMLCGCQSSRPHPVNPSSAQAIVIAEPLWSDYSVAVDRQALAADTIHFAFDSAVIEKNETLKLQAIVAALNSDKSAILLVEGNCDERGSEEYNRLLGQRRAEAAREALVKMGIDPNRVHALSYGKDKPVGFGHDEVAWAKNSRDDFILLRRK